MSIKTGGCSEDCAYCPQSAHYKTSVVKEKLLSLNKVKKSIQQANELGATRFCMGAAWSGVKDGADFDRILEMVKAVKKAGMQACVTLGRLTETQAEQLKMAGLDAYNHNLDTGPNYYDQVITTRTYQDRLQTLSIVQKAGLAVCSGGILGMGETVQDRLEMLNELLKLPVPPESIPINLLIPVPGTPLERASPVEVVDLVRMIAVTKFSFLPPMLGCQLVKGTESRSSAYLFLRRCELHFFRRKTTDK